MAKQIKKYDPVTGKSNIEALKNEELPVISHTSLTNIGTNTHTDIDNHIADTSKHFTQAQIDHVNILNKGVKTHAQLDSHTNDATIHFTQAQINHNSILNRGTNTHTAIDSHIADTSRHFLQTEIDHVNLLSKGVNTHGQIDSHIADGTKHFTEASIDHTHILNKGTNTHTQLDNHVADSTIHFLQSAINHNNILNKGTNTHSQLDSHVADATRHFTQAEIDHNNILNKGTNSHTAIDSHLASTSNPHGVTASQTSVSTIAFNKNLSATENTVQKALDKLDDVQGMPVGSDSYTLRHNGTNWIATDTLMLGEDSAILGGNLELFNLGKNDIDALVVTAYTGRSAGVFKHSGGAGSILKGYEGSTQVFEIAADGSITSVDLKTVKAHSTNHKALYVNTDTGFIYPQDAATGGLTSVNWGDIGGTLASQTDLQAALNAKENSFTKNTAFNKNFGTTAGTVSEGNHTHPAMLTDISNLQSDVSNINGDITDLQNADITINSNISSLQSDITIINTNITDLQTADSGMQSDITTLQGDIVTINSALDGKSDVGHTHTEYIPKSDFTAKGQILVATGSGTYVALTPGADGMILQRDDLEATGWKFVPMPGGTDTEKTRIAYNTLPVTRNVGQTTLTIESDFSLSVEAGAVYQLDAHFAFNIADSNQYAEMQFRLPGTTKGYISGMTSGDGVTGESYLYGANGLDIHYSRLITQQFGLLSLRDEPPTHYTITGMFSTDTAGNLDLYWALRAPSTANVSMDALSWVKLTKV